MSKPKILVTGSNGQVGKELQALSPLHAEFQFFFYSKSDLSINDSILVNDCFDEIRPQYCINCAAYTAVDKAEIETEQAFLINGEAAGILAAACKSFNTKFVHISTDYVFNGRGTQPYKEDHPVDPVNAYGASKYKGEELVLQENDEAIIIRTSWVYSEYGNNFVKTIIRLLKEREQLGIVNDQYGSPTYAADLSMAILEIFKSGKWKGGIYHYSNEGIISWYQFAEAIREFTGSNCKILPITTVQFPTPARRPAYSAFEKEKIKSVYSIKIPLWQDSLQKCLKKIMT